MDQDTPKGTETTGTGKTGETTIDRGRVKTSPALSLEKPEEIPLDMMDLVFPSSCLAGLYMDFRA